jgi:hypothetical protein
MVRGIIGQNIGLEYFSTGPSRLSTVVSMGNFFIELALTLKGK